MALVEQNLQTEIEKAIYESANKVYNGNVDKQTREFSRRLSVIITNYIKTATVTVQPGQTVSVVLPAGTGATTSPGTGSLS